MTNLQTERLIQIGRRWMRLSGEWSLASRWGWSISFMVGIYSLLASIYLELAFWQSGLEPWWPFSLIAWHPMVWGTCGLLVVWNGWVMAGHLENPLDSRLPGWLRWFWVAMASIPVLGMYAVPAWRRLVSDQPSWLRERLRPEPQLDLSRSGIPRARLLLLLERLQHRTTLSRPGIVLWLFAGQITPALALVSWLADRGWWSQPRKWVVLGICIAFRLVAVASFLVYERVGLKRSNLQGRLARGLCLALLLPFPVAILGLCSFLLLEDAAFVQSFYYQQKIRTTRLQTLVPRSLQGPLLILWRQSRWRKERALREPFPGDRKYLGESERRRRSLYRLKIFLLFLDGGALGWWLSRFHGPAVSRWGSTALMLSLVLAGLGLIISAVGVTARFLGSRKLGGLVERYPYGTYLTLTQAMLMIGLLTGSALAVGGAEGAKQLHLVGLLSVNLFALGAVLFGFRIMTAGGDATRISSTFAHFSLWTAVFLGFSFLAALSGARNEAAQPFQNVLQWAFWLSPVLNLAVGLGLGGWLVRPFPLRLFSRGLPWRVQAVRAFLALSAALPLGGLFIPLWIFARRNS